MTRDERIRYLESALEHIAHLLSADTPDTGSTEAIARGAITGGWCAESDLPPGRVVMLHEAIMDKFDATFRGLAK